MAIDIYPWFTPQLSQVLQQVSLDGQTKGRVPKKRIVRAHGQTKNLQGSTFTGLV